MKIRTMMVGDSMIRSTDKYVVETGLDNIHLSENELLELHNQINDIILKDINTIDLDFERYGLKLHHTGKEGCLFYRKEIPDGYIEVMESLNVVSIYVSLYGEKEMTVALRYKCKSQDDLDFLLTKGRIGFYFNLSRNGS